jgi:hypothetical protein
MKRVLLLVLLAFPLVNGFGQEIVYPDRVIQCLKNPKASSLKVLTDNNPYYLRGEFDGDAKPDYALQVRSKGGVTGVLVCLGNGSLQFLGAGIGGKKFSDMPEDNFVAPHWEVFTEQDVTELSFWKHNVPDAVPVIKRREAIAMIWEDGISLIYWDGVKFRWAGSKE